MKVELKLFVAFGVLVLFTLLFLPEVDQSLTREDLSRAGVLLPTVGSQ